MFPYWETCSLEVVTLQKGKSLKQPNSPRTCGLENVFVVKPKEIVRAQIRKKKAVFPLNYRLPFVGRDSPASRGGGIVNE